VVQVDDSKPGTVVVGRVVVLVGGGPVVAAVGAVEVVGAGRDVLGLLVAR
jgi:hypothetical protein